jgi:hypothetical protein
MTNFIAKCYRLFLKNPKIVLFYSTFVIPFVSYAQLSLTSVGTAVVIDFSTAINGVNAASLNSVATTEFMNSAPSSGKLDADAWAILLDGAGTGDVATFPGTTGTTPVFATLTAFGGTSTGIGAGNFSNDRELVLIPSGSYWTNGSLTLKIANNTGETLTGLSVSYKVKVYNDQGRSNKIEFWYSSTNTLNSYTEVASARVTSGEAAALPYLSEVTKSMNITGLSFTNGGEFYVRWNLAEVSGAGARDEFTLDDISITGTTGSSVPSIALSSPSAAASNITQGSTNQQLYRFDMAVSTANTNLNGIAITTSGTYQTADISNLKCWYSSDATFNSASDILLSTKTSSLGAGSHTFPSFTSQTISSGSTGYIFITADLPFTATAGNTISINAVTSANITVSSGSFSGTANGSGTKTIIVCTPTNATAPTLTVGTNQLSVAWSNPACYDELLIVAKPTSTISASPSGDGSSYTSNLIFGSGTVFDGTGSVVYKGTSSPQIITGLTNGTVYFVKIFTRRGSVWSSGIVSSATPALTNATRVNYTGSTGGAWLTTSNWSTSSVPSSSQLAAFAGSQTGIGINMASNSGLQTIGALEMESAKSGDLLIGNSSTSSNGILTVNGVIVNGIENVVIRNNDDNHLTLQNTQGSGNRLMNISFAHPTNNKIVIDGAGGIIISCDTINASGPVSIGGTGGGVATFSGQNLYTYLTTVEGATLRLNRTGGNSLPATNNVNVSGGNLRISTNQTLNNLTLSSGILTIDSGVTLSINGTLNMIGGSISNSGTLLIGNSGVLQVNAGVALGLGGTITNNGSILLKASSASNYAQFMPTGIWNGTGSVTQERFISGNRAGWRWVGSPVNGGFLSSFGSTVTIGAGNNNIITLNNANPNAWVGFHTLGQSITSPLQAGRGYGVYFGTGGVNGNDSAATISLTGSLVTSDVNAIISNGDSGDGFGWSLVGNPFTSGMNFSGISKTNFEDNYYVWDATANSGNGAYASYNAATATSNPLGTLFPIIPPMQGFLVKAMASGATMSFPLAARSISPVRPQLRGIAVYSQRMYIRVTNPIAGRFDETAILSVPLADDRFESTFDARKLNSWNSNALNLATVSSDNQRLSINTTGDWDAALQVPLQLTTTLNSPMQLSVDLSEVASGQAVWLEDLHTGAYHDLRAGSYAFTHLSNVSDRFRIHFRALSTSVSPDPLAGVQLYAHDGKVIVRGWDGPFALEAYDLQGRRVASGAFEAGMGSDGWFSGVSPGIYLVRCTTSEGAKSVKLRL